MQTEKTVASFYKWGFQFCLIETIRTASSLFLDMLERACFGKTLKTIKDCEPLIKEFDCFKRQQACQNSCSLERKIKTSRVPVTDSISWLEPQATLGDPIIPRCLSLRLLQTKPPQSGGSVATSSHNTLSSTVHPVMGGIFLCYHFASTFQRSGSQRT